MFPRGKNIHNKLITFLNESDEKKVIENEIKFEEIQNDKQEEIKEKQNIDSFEKEDQDQKIILSSKIARQMEFVPGDFSLKWDNINEYEKILQRSFNKEIKLGSFEG